EAACASVHRRPPPAACHQPLGRSAEVERSAGRLTGRSPARPTILAGPPPRVDRIGNRGRELQMKRFRKLCVLVAAAGAGTLPLALVAAGGAAGSTTPSGSQTLQFLDVTQRFVPVPAITRTAPPQIGGRLIFDDALYNRAAQFGQPC